MIDEARTKQLYGYTSDEVGAGSHKLIVFICPECGKEKFTEIRNYKGICGHCLKSGSRSAWLGKHHTDETKKKIGDVHRGKKHYNWKGGLQKMFDHVHKSSAYRIWRNAVLERDSYMCQKCSHKSKSGLHAHHIVPVRDCVDDYDMLYSVDNGITLCKKCHIGISHNEHEYINKFNAIVGGKK